MSNTDVKENMEFQAEVKQLLDIVINSLYTDREIFLRELISNAADALEKLRYLTITNNEVRGSDLPQDIAIETDDVAHTLTITDTGVGMSKNELVENLGTIAHSGSKAFIKNLEEGNKEDVNLIGQFGVGFYAAFMVAEKVTIYTQSYLNDEVGCIWTSEGSGTFSIKEADNLQRGTKILLQLKEDAYDFIKPETVKRIIKQYSSFVPFPILLSGEKVNTVQAIWTKNKNEVSDEEYKEFYKYIANAYDEPLFKLHLKLDAPLDLNALLFVPKENYEQLGFDRMEPGVNLYCRKVLIQQKAEGILPDWLRFIKGVVDSEELPLNISRETMQDSALVSKLRRVITGKLLKYLNEEAKKSPEKYKEFWDKFSMFIKEGAANDFSHQEELLKLLRFESSASEPEKLVSLKDYVERMKEEQKEIYFVNGPNRQAIESGPYLEIFRQRELEVIYTKDPIDDYIFERLGEFEGKKLVSADSADLKLPGENKELAGEKLEEEKAKALTTWLKEALGEKVKEVRPSERLVDNPAIILSPGGLTNTMDRLMQVMKKDLNGIGPKVLEVNTAHPIIKKLSALSEKKDPIANVAAEQIYDNALISAGLLVDPRGMLNHINQLLERALQ